VSGGFENENCGRGESEYVSAVHRRSGGEAAAIVNCVVFAGPALSFLPDVDVIAVIAGLPTTEI